MQYSRRALLKTGIGTTLGLTLPSAAFTGFAAANPAPRKKLPVAAVVTVYRSASHADVILGKILEGYRHDGGEGPDLELVSLYTDQVPEGDMSRDKARQHGFRISPTIEDALTLGTNQLQVAGVLCIGEHGDYPKTPDTAQRLYPRRRFFDEVTATFKKAGKVVPVFNDKHLSCHWADAQAMMQTASQMKFPFLAGSSVPGAWRTPPLDLPLDCEIESAVSIGYGGLEDYGFHALEAHQCLLERRRGGETGVASVRAVTGQQILESEQAGEWSQPLFEAALKTMPGMLTDNERWRHQPNSAVYLIEHRDGLRSAVVMANGLAAHFAGAVKLKNKSAPAATWFKLQEGWPYGHFAYLVRAIDETFHSGKTAWPIERTLLTTGILDRAMHSLANGGQTYKTPELEISYRGNDWPFASHPDSPLQLPND